MYVFNELYCKSEETRFSKESPIFGNKKQLEGLKKAIIITAEGVVY